MWFSSPKRNFFRGPHWGSLQRPLAGGEGLASPPPRTPPPLSGLALSIPTFYSGAPRMATWPHCRLLFQTRKFRRFVVSLGVVVKRYILQQKVSKKWIGSAMLGTRRYNFQLIHRSWATQYTVLQTDRRTDWRQYHANSRSWSARNIYM